ncbi:hypothetical protein [Pandoraea sp. NPDC090278]|uniref:hypothetical protein n=1 Tax=Pandoraea sp. NPDC090278 TaxID=3364391 RepID=UPI00383B593F
MNYNRICTFALFVLTLGIGSVEAEPESPNIQGAQINNPYPESAPVHASYAKFIIRMRSDPTAQAFAATTTRANAFRKGTNLSLSGLKRLDDTSLENRMRIVSKILDNASDSECEAILQGPSSRPGPSAMDSGLIKLNQADADLWFTMAAEAALAEIRQDSVPSLKQEDVNEALSRIEASLPPEKAPKFAFAQQNPQAVSPSEACWAMRTLYREGSSLPEPYRAALARATVTH